MAKQETGCFTKIVSAVALLIAFKMCSSVLSGDKPSSPPMATTPADTKIPGNVTASANPPPPLGNFPKLDAVSLRQAYSANEIAADAKYKGRRFRITGTATAIQRDVLGAAQIILVSDLGGVVANDAGNEFAATVNRGDRVSITCVVDGEFAGMVSLSCNGPQ